jgi:hypothetical protein
VAAPAKGVARITPIQLAIRRVQAQRAAPPAPAAGRVTQETRVTGSRTRGKPKRRRGHTGALYDPTQQLSGNDLAGAANDLTNLEFGPQRSAINRALGVATTQGTALADRAQGYYQQLDQTDAPIAGQEAAIGQLLSDKLGGNATAANTAIAASLKGAQDRAAADEQVRGQIGGSQTAGASSEAQQAGDVVTENTHAAQDAGTASTGDFQQLATLARQSRQQAGGEAHTELLNRLANQQAGYRGQLTDLGKSEGAARSKNLTDLRQQAFENLITQRGLNIKAADLAAQTTLGQQKLAEDRRQSQADRRVRLRIARDARLATKQANDAKAQGKANDINKYGISNAQWLGMSTQQRLAAIRDFTKAAHVPGKGGKGGASAPSAHSVGIVTQVENARNDAMTDPKLKNLSGAKLQQRYVKRGLPPLYATAAQQLHDFGYVTPETQAALERSGVTLPAAWRQTGAQAFTGPH